MISKMPLQLDHPRVWRTYLGGRELDRFLDTGSTGEDGHFPEEWIMSVVEARNAGREVAGEGLSRLLEQPEVTLRDVLSSNPGAFLGKEHAAAFGSQPGVLVKLIDSAERLTIQVHPDRQKAKELFHSAFGKTECWYIMDVRADSEEEPCIYIGFREGTTREQWKDLFDRQDIPGMLSCLHRFAVKPGDTILIQGGVPHAIGPGCFLMEIQEPTDYTIRVERTTPSGFPVVDELCHQGLGFETMFDCFTYGGETMEDAREKWFLKKRCLSETASGAVYQLVDYSDTPFFAMRELGVITEMTLESEGFSALYVLEGSGSLRWNAQKIALQSPAQLFVPAGMGELKLQADSGAPLRIMQCFGPKETLNKSSATEQRIFHPISSV